MSIPSMALAAVSAWTVLLVPAWAAPPAGPLPAPVLTNEPAAAPDARQWERMHRASRLIGARVVTREGRKVGELRDLIVDTQGNVTMGVVSSGGFMGIGDRLRAVPWDSLKPGDEGERILDAPPAVLQQTPAFDGRAWPNLSDERWISEQRRLFGQ